LVVSPHHVRLSLGKLCPVALIGVAGKLRPLASYHPGNFIFPRLSTFRAVQGMCPLLRGLIEKVPLFHVPHFSGALKSLIVEAYSLTKHSQIEVSGTLSNARTIPY